MVEAGAVGGGGGWGVGQTITGQERWPIGITGSETEPASVGTTL